MGTGRSAVVEEERPSEVRWTSRRKADAVVRLLRGEDLDELSQGAPGGGPSPGGVAR
ncbi:MAG: hypothetical protein ACRDHJ_12760 [Actinomycetota bacterium]